jgi:general secretion pathway protein G
MILRSTRSSAPRRIFRDARRAFTLMEVLVVVAIIFILASVSTVVVFRYLDDAKEKTAALGVKNIDTAVTAWRTTYGDFPNSLDDLVNPSQDGKPAVLEIAAVTDPWGRQYVYERETRNPRTGKPLIYSTGPEPGNAATFIRNWVQ